MTQMLLFPNPKPLVEKLGREFFRGAPETSGVYLMRDAADSVLYVGKAKNLRRRLGSYRVANPDRMPRRHLRMLRAVVRIELQECADEPAALARESELIRLLKPRFNRAGTWPPKPRFLAWRRDGKELQFAIAENPEPGWAALGPMGAAAKYLLHALVRLLWCAVHPEAGVCRMPLGWAHGQFAEVTSVPAGTMLEDVATLLEKLFSGNSDPFLAWLSGRIPTDLHPFDKTVIESDVEFLSLPIRLKA